MQPVGPDQVAGPHTGRPDSAGILSNGADLRRNPFGIGLFGLLRECGDLILPGLRADDVPFIVMGDDGCAVLVDYPSPPRGAVPYNGPSPLKAQLSVVRSKLDLPKGLEFGAAVIVPRIVMLVAEVVAEVRLGATALALPPFASTIPSN